MQHGDNGHPAPAAAAAAFLHDSVVCTVPSLLWQGVICVMVSSIPCSGHHNSDMCAEHRSKLLRTLRTVFGALHAVSLKCIPDAVREQISPKWMTLPTSLYRNTKLLA